MLHLLQRIFLINLASPVSVKHPVRAVCIFMSLVAVNILILLSAILHTYSLTRFMRPFPALPRWKDRLQSERRTRFTSTIFKTAVGRHLRVPIAHDLNREPRYRRHWNGRRSGADYTPPSLR